MTGLLEHGQVIRMTHFTNYRVNLQMTYKAPKDKVFLFVLLGVEDRDGLEPADPLELMRALGWKQEDPNEEKT